MTNTANKLVWLRRQPTAPAPVQPVARVFARRLVLSCACSALIMIELSGQSSLPQLPAAVAPVVAVAEAPVAAKAAIEVEAEPLRVRYVNVDLFSTTNSVAEVSEELALTPPPAEGLLLNNQLAYLRYRSQAAAAEVALAPEIKANTEDRINLQSQTDNRAQAPLVALADTAAVAIAQESVAQPKATAAPSPQVPKAEASSLASSSEQSPLGPEDLTFSLDSEAQLSVVNEKLVAAPRLTPISSGNDDFNIAGLDADLTTETGGDDYVYMLDELQPERRGYYESLDFSGHLFSNKAANRFIIVDGKARAEQEALDETTVVEAITADGVILRTNGESVFVDITSRIN